MLLEELKYNLQTTSEQNAYCNYGYSEEYPKSQKFFAKPRIKIHDNLKKEQINLTLTEFDKHPENFIINFWTLEIENTKRHKSKILTSKNAYNSCITMNILENNKTKYDNGLMLLWRRYDLITIWNAGSIKNDSKREEYMSKLPSILLSQIGQNPESIELTKKTSNDILLFFTFDGSDSTFLVSSEEKGIGEDKISNYMLPFNKEFVIQIRFQSLEYGDSEGKLFKFNANSWDDIHFERTRSY